MSLIEGRTGEWEIVIGLEVHAQVVSNAKLFSGAATAFGATQYALFALAAVLMGLAAAPALMVTETLLQEATEPGVRGRVFGARDFLMRSVLLLSVGLAGWVTRGLGPQAALLVAGVLVLGVSGLAIARLTAAGRTPR